MKIAAVTCVGRDEELAELARRTAATTTTGAALIAITGQPGIGKSVLLRRFAEQHPGTVWWAQAADWESAIPGALLRQLFQENLPADPIDAASRIADLVANCGRSHPPVIVVDDAEQADSSSVQALATAARGHRDLPWLTVLAVRECRGLVGKVVSDELRLGGLDPAAVAQLAALHDRVLHPAMIELLAHHTGGNPRHLVALLQDLPTAMWSQPEARLPAPAHVVAQVRGQLEQCGPSGRKLVRALAILSEEESLDAAVQLADIEDPLEAIDEAAAAGLLTVLPEYRPQLPNPLIRAAVIEVMGMRTACALHRRAAETVTDPVRRLRHRVAATPLVDGQLADEVDRLARRRGAEGAWAQAARLFRDASRLSPDPTLRDERLIRSVDALVAAGDCVGAAALVPAIESLPETPLRDAVLAYLAIVRGRAAEAALRLDRAWAFVQGERDPQTAALIAQRYVLHYLACCRGAELVDWADRATALAGEDSPAGVEAAAIRGLGLSASGQFHAAAAAYNDLSSRIRHGAQAQRVTMGHGWLQLSQDDIDGARSSLESAVAMATLGGSARITLWSLGWLSRVQFLIGDWDRALHSVEQGNALAASTGIVLATPLLAWTAAQIHALRGDWEQAKAVVRSADAVTHDYPLMQLPVALARGHIAEAEADYPQVQRALNPLTRMQSGTVLHEPVLWPWADLMATALVTTSQLDAAEALLRHHRQYARGLPSAMARWHASRGRLLGARGDLAGARTAFDEALALLDGLPLRYDLARVNFGYGQMLRRAGKRRAADTIINTARELYLSLGAQTFVQRCDRELKAGGVHRLRGTRDRVELTPQEDAVTSLVVQGLSNREVAAELYVSPKTVQYHLTRVYAKLGVRSRTELAALRR